MTVRFRTDAIILSGACGVDEVETLVTHLESSPELPVDISAATMIHTAIWQALMVFRPNVIGSPMSSLIAGKLLDGLNAHHEHTRKR